MGYSREKASKDSKDTKLDKQQDKNEEKREPGKKPGLFQAIFRYSDSKDMLLMVLGMFGCFADGSSTPLIMLVVSKIMNNYAVSTSFTLHDINQDSMTLVYVAIAVGLGAFLEGICWARTAERQTSRLRRKYLWAVLRQDAGLVDIQQGSLTTYQVVSSISADTLTIQGVLSEKMPNFLMNIAVFISSQGVALYLCWKLAAVAIPALSLLIIPGIIYGKQLAELGKKIQEAYGVAGGIAEQAFSSIRTVYSYVGENRTSIKFSAALERSQDLGIRQGLMKGFAIGSAGISFVVMAFQAWYGSILVTKKGAKGGDVFAAAVCIVTGGLLLQCPWEFYGQYEVFCRGSHICIYDIRNDRASSSYRLSFLNRKTTGFILHILLPHHFLGVFIHLFVSLEKSYKSNRNGSNNAQEITTD